MPSSTELESGLKVYSVHVACKFRPEKQKVGEAAAINTQDHVHKVCM